jgi:hypothetical protein
MFARSIPLLLAAVLAQDCWAQHARIEGTYSSAAVSAQVILLDAENGVAAVKAEVFSGPCSGAIAGVGRIERRVLTVTPYAKLPDGEACSLALAFDPAWKRVKISGENCAAYSGAACGFEGQTATRRSERDRRATQ